MLVIFFLVGGLGSGLNYLFSMKCSDLLPFSDVTDIGANDRSIGQADLLAEDLFALITDRELNHVSCKPDDLDVVTIIEGGLLDNLRIHGSPRFVRVFAPISAQWGRHGKHRAMLGFRGKIGLGRNAAQLMLRSQSAERSNECGSA
jgi:hypothetical protein